MKLRAIDGLPVMDAKHAITITVTKADVEKADVKQPEGCAAARAINREMHSLEARVHLGRVYVKTNKDHWTRFMTPKNLRSEIIAFDRGGTFEPGEYTLSAPQPNARLTGRRRGAPHHSDRLGSTTRKPKMKRRPPTIVKNVRTGPA